MAAQTQNRHFGLILNIHRIFLLVVACFFLFSLPAAAQERAPDFIQGNTQIVTQFSQQAKQALPDALMSDGDYVPEEIPLTFDGQELIPFDDAKRVVNRGLLSGMAEMCGLNWEENSYLPFMQIERATHLWSDEQIAFIGVLHGVAQGHVDEIITETPACDAFSTENVEDMLLLYYPDT